MRRSLVKVGRRYKLVTGGRIVVVLRFDGEWIHVRHCHARKTHDINYKGSSFSVRAHARQVFK